MHIPHLKLKIQYWLPTPGPGNLGSPGGSDGKKSVCNAADQGLTPGLGRYP